MKLPRRTYYYKPKKKPSDKALIASMEQICLDFPRYHNHYGVRSFTIT